MVKVISAVVLLLTLYICATIATKKEKRELEESLPTYVFVDTASLNFKQQIYVPVNSNLYTNKRLKKELTTVLKIRNVSSSDSLYVFRVEYFDTEGQPKKKIVDSAVLIKPMATTQVIVKNKDFDTVGDNFIVEWRANNPKHFPLIQAISFEPGNRLMLREDGIVLNEKTEVIP